MTVLGYTQTEHDRAAFNAQRLAKMCAGQPRVNADVIKFAPRERNGWIVTVMEIAAELPRPVVFLAGGLAVIGFWGVVAWAVFGGR